MGAQLGGKGVMSDMNLTPLIDIVLVVLIIMMVNVPIQIEEMGVKLPGAEVKTSRFDVPAEQLVIGVYPDGQLGLNRRLMTEDVLFYEVTRRLRPMDKKNVFIDAHPEVDYGLVVHMMDLARGAGASKVGLAKMKPEGPLEPTSVAPGSLPRGVQLGNPNPIGFMTGKVADKAIQPLMGAVNGCWNQALARNGALSGRMTGKVAVAPDGSLMEFSVTGNNVEDPELELCVTEVLGRLQFAPLGEENTALVLYPFLFSPG
ncbi:MAG: biopolymer transporter ExbD [Deltaproteobacteria bacterium]|nr:biopolymer transporter ExbD [Deltaproteobacteria bacterium]